MSDALLSWRRLIDADVRERKLALARARQAVTRGEQIEALLLAERDRRDQSERERRAGGELPTFAQERMTALLERAIERAEEKVAAAKVAEGGAVARLREAWTRLTALDRLLARRREQARIETLRHEQKELDEIAGRHSLAEVELAALGEELR